MAKDELDPLEQETADLLKALSDPRALVESWIPRNNEAVFFVNTTTPPYYMAQIRLDLEALSLEDLSPFYLLDLQYAEQQPVIKPSIFTGPVYITHHAFDLIVRQGELENVIAAMKMANITGNDPPLTQSAARTFVGSGQGAFSFVGEQVFVRIVFGHEKHGAITYIFTELDRPMRPVD